MNANEARHASQFRQTLRLRASKINVESAYERRIRGSSGRQHRPDPAGGVSHSLRIPGGADRSAIRAVRGRTFRAAEVGPGAGHQFHRAVSRPGGPPDFHSGTATAHRQPGCNHVRQRARAGRHIGLLPHHRAREDGLPDPRYRRGDRHDSGRDRSRRNRQDGARRGAVEPVGTDCHDQIKRRGCRRQLGDRGHPGRASRRESRPGDAGRDASAAQRRARTPRCGFPCRGPEARR